MTFRGVISDNRRNIHWTKKYILIYEPKMISNRISDTFSFISRIYNSLFRWEFIFQIWHSTWKSKQEKDDRNKINSHDRYKRKYFLDFFCWVDLFLAIDTFGTVGSSQYENFDDFSAGCYITPYWAYMASIVK